MPENFNVDEIEYGEIDGRKGVSIGGGEEYFLDVERKGRLWCFRLLDVFHGVNPITGWVKLRHIQDLRRKRVAKPIREWIGQWKNADAIIERIIITIESREDVWRTDEKGEGTSDKNIKFEEDIQERAWALLRDSAFFYKLGKVFEHGFMVPKIKKPRFVIREERNKRITGPILIGAAKLNMTSLFKLLGGIGTAKDTILRMWLTLLSSGIKHVERSYMTAASLRYSEYMKAADLLYIPDSPRLKGETGRHIRFMRADDGGLISEYATRDAETGEMTTKVVTLPIKAVATTSNEITGDAAVESGMWTLKTNDAKNLTDEVKMEKLKFRAGKRPLFPEEELKVWFCAFKILMSEELLEKLPIVPYAEKLKPILDSTSSASRRDPEKLCDLISVIGWMRRFQKEEEKRGETDLVDLYFTLQMGFTAIAQTISELNDKERKIVEAVRNASIDEVTCRYVANATGIPYKTCYNYLEELIWGKGILLKDKAGGRNIYSCFSGKTGGDFLDRQRGSFDKPETLMKFILTSFRGFSLSHQDANSIFLIDPITGDKITVKWKNNGQTSSPEVTVTEKTYSYPYEKGRNYQRGTETVPELEKQLREFLLSAKRREQAQLGPAEEKPAILKEALQKVVSTLLNLERETGIVEKVVLRKQLESEHKLPVDVVDPLLALLLREGTIYSPREGYLKKT